MWWKLLLANLIKPAQSLPFGRSIAFLTGVSQYESLSPRALPAVENDLTDLRNYLLTKGGFDTVYEARNSAVTRNLIEQYMKYEFTSQRSLLGKDDRLLFYYSGHGADQQGKLGYLQFTTAKSGEFFRNDTLAVADFQQMSKVVAA